MHGLLLKHQLMLLPKYLLVVLEHVLLLLGENTSFKVELAIFSCSTNKSISMPYNVVFLHHYYSPAWHVIIASVHNPVGLWRYC